MEEFEANLRPYKLALVEAFGLMPEQTSENISATPHAVTFQCVGVVPGVAAGPLSRAWMSGISGSDVTTVEVRAKDWTHEQREAVEAYMEQFPSPGEFLGMVGR